MATANHNQRQELEGKFIGVVRARQENVPVNLGRWSDEELRERWRRLGGGGDGVE